MQNTESKKIHNNQIYTLAKKSLPLTKPKKERALSQLGKIIGEAFEKNQDSVIDEATNLAYKNSEVDVFNIISEEIQISVECMVFESKNHSFYSNIMLLPVLFKSQKNTEIILPSIKEMEILMKQSLVEDNIYSNANFINFAAYRFDQKTAENLSLKEWWSTHRDIAHKFLDGMQEDIESKNERTKIVNKDGFLMVYYVLHLHYDMESEDAPNLNFLDNRQFWTSVYQKFNQPNILQVIAIPPDGIFESLTGGKVFLEYEQFSLFMSIFANSREVEILVSPVETIDDPSQYCVFITNADDRTLVSFYAYDLYGGMDEIKNMFEIICKYSHKHSIPFYKSTDCVMVEQLNEYASSNISIDLNKVFKHSEYVDVMGAFVNLSNNSLH